MEISQQAYGLYTTEEEEEDDDDEQQKLMSMKNPIKWSYNTKGADVTAPLLQTSTCRQCDRNENVFCQSPSHSYITLLFMYTRFMLIYNLQVDNIRTTLTRIIIADNGDVFVMSAVMISPTSVRTIAKHRLPARAL